ncbi:phage holin family protein [Candidatus Peregrinibacteria bacterium]|nr:MAG: phage holin family protein [Candidatus Peregrinibacteria bacterium]
MIKKILIYLAANALALFLTSELLSNTFAISGGYKGYAIAALIFAILNGVMKPILKILSLPFVVVTAGVFVLVINMFLVWFAKYALDVLKFEGVQITVTGGISTYIFAALIIAWVNMVIVWLFKNN